jgi:5-methyltetrahydrofolate--homocysteine methyltransferase
VRPAEKQTACTGGSGQSHYELLRLNRSDKIDQKRFNMSILDEMKVRRLYCDGGMGSLLQAAGLAAGELPERWNISHPEVITDVHRKYLAAGADIMTTNTFGANRLKYDKDGELKAIVEAAIANARKAVEEAGRGYVALDLGPTGKLLKPLGDLPFETAVSLYKEVVSIGAAAGADLVLIETMSDSYELKAAVLAAKEAGINPETGARLPIFATVIYDEKGKLLTGGNVESTVALLEGLGVDVLGVNCGLGPEQMKGIVKDILEVSSTPILVNPNAGLPRSENGKTVYDVDPKDFAAVMEEIVRMGAVITGGCCGTTPDHIHAMVELTKDIPVQMPEKKHRTVISSYSQAVVFDKKTIIIGERINPTGKSKFKQALRDHNLEYILREGVTQQDNGADVLDVNVGLPEIDEPSMMEDVVKELQAVIDLPLQLDTSSAEAMERGLRVYNGKPLINSVNGKKEVMEQIFPLVAKYGGVVVGLCLDEDGIPETAEGRIAVGKKIIDTAAAYGIGPEDIILDGLCMTVSSDSQGAIVTLETLRKIRDELGGKSVLGVSNISFGLPQREIINGAFFTMAMESGLSAAIINPNSEAMMRAYYSFNALMNLDPQCSEYISIYSGQTAGLGQTIGKGGNGAGGSGAAGNGGAGSAGSLGNAIERGLKEVAVESVTALLKEKEALDVINEEIIPALDHVGKGFEKGTVFLPQLLMSAEAAKAAFEVIKNAMAGSGETQEKKGTIILATVKGDIHDIGKNIVKVLLENYSYDVIDLGKDVPPETVVEEAVSRHVPLVGLSALMTTTVPSMEETIKQLRESAPWVKVMVGGAVLTQEYADTIGADAYCKDAMASVHYAETVI